MSSMPNGVAARPRLTHVTWPGVGSFWLTCPQLRVVDTLLDALICNHSGEVSEERLLAVAQSADAPDLVALFDDSQAWGKLVVAGQRKGAWRLPPIPLPPE